MINVVLSINAITSYPLQILCAFEIIENLSFFKEPTDSVLKHSIKMYTERVGVIIIVTVASIVIPNFVDFLNISGSLGAASLGFILPSFYYIKAKGGLRNLPRMSAVFNCFLMCFGVFGAIYSLYTSITNIIDEY